MQLELYETQSGEIVADNIKVATGLKHSPEHIKAALQMQLSVAGSSFAALRSAIRTMAAATADFDGKGARRGQTYQPDPGDDPMEIGAVSGKSGGKGKSKDKGGRKQKGKGKQKSNDKGGNQSTTGRGRGYTFDGECGYCGNYGHKRSECGKSGGRSRQRKGKELGQQGR